MMIQDEEASMFEQVTRKVWGLKEEIKRLRDRARDTTLWEYAENIPKVSSKLKVRRTLKGSLGMIRAMQWASNKDCLVAVSTVGQLLLWNAWAASRLLSIPLRTSWVMACAYSPSSNFVASGGLDNQCSIFNLQSTTPATVVRVLGGHDGYISCCRFLSDKEMVTSSGDLSCMLWDVAAETCVTTFQGHNGDVMSVSIEADKQQHAIFISGSCDSLAKLWDVRSGKCELTFHGHESDINAIQFFPNGNCFGTASDDETCRLFDIRAQRELMVYSKIDQNCGRSLSVDFSKSGRYLFSAWDNYTVSIWDTLKGDEIDVLRHHNNTVTCLGVSSDGGALCTGSWDCNLKILA